MESFDSLEWTFQLAACNYNDVTLVKDTAELEICYKMRTFETLKLLNCILWNSKLNVEEKINEKSGGMDLQTLDLRLSWKVWVTNYEYLLDELMNLIHYT